MIISNVNIGSGPGANDGESIYSAFYKVNQNFANVQSNVNSLTNSVSSVAGRTGNVTLTINDIVGLNTSYALNSNVTAANVGMKGYVDAKIAANVAALIDSAPGALDTLNELAAALNDDASFATTIVNTVTLANTIQSQQIAAANIGMIGYVDNKVSTANIAMKGYVDSVASQSIFGNANVASYLHANNYNPYSNVNVAAYLPTYGGNIKVTGILNGGNAIHVYNTLHIQGDAGGNGLFVGDPNVEITPYGNTIASFHANVNGPVYLNVHNANTGAESVTGVVISSDIGDTTDDNMILAIFNSGYNSAAIYPNVKPGDCLVDSTQGNLWIGSDSKTINFFTRDSIPEQISLVSIDTEPGVYRGNLKIHEYVDLYFLSANSKIYFGDGSIQTTAYTGYGNTHVAAYTNLSTYAYNANITASNIGMKGYVDSLTYSNVQTTAYLTTNNYLTETSANLSNYAWASNVGSTYGNVEVAAYLPTYTGNISANYFNLTSNSSALSFNNGAYIYGDQVNRIGSIVLQPAASGTFPSVIVGGAGRLAAPNGSVHVIFNSSDLTVQVQQKITAGTSSSSTTSGALVVTGGVGVSGNINVGGNASVTGILTNNYYYANGTPVSFGGSSYSNVEVGVFTNLSNYAYNANVTAANVGMKGYVDSLTYSNVQAESFITTFSGNVPQASLAYTVNISPVIVNLEYQLALLPAKEGAWGIKAADGTANVTYNPVSNRLTSANIQATGSIQTSGINGRIGYSAGGFVQQITANSNGVSLNTVTGNIQLMGINLGVNGLHTVSFTNNKLEETDMILVTHHSGGVSNFAVGAYYAAPSTAIIWIRNITGADTSTVTPMLKFALIKAPGA